MCSETLLSLPTLFSKEENIRLLCGKVYGFLPPPPDKLSFAVQKERQLDKNICVRTYRLTVAANGRRHAFPFFFTYPRTGKNGQTILHINFRPDIPDRYMPAGTICAQGFCLLSFGYEDVTRDNEDFSDGIAKLFFPNGTRQDTAAGKLILWAWAAMRVLDAAQTIPDIPTKKVTVAGHSRLGKTALLAGGLDERFSVVYANDSGRAGAALHRDHNGEPLSHMRKNFPHWFCPDFNAQKWEVPETFDQHFLLALTAPRKLYIASAAEDAWADPQNEFLGLFAAQNAWTEKESFFSASLPKAGTYFYGKNLSYHCRPGGHAFREEDWQLLLDYLKSLPD